MYTDLFNDFINGTDTIRIYEGETLVFSSKKDRLLPLMEYSAQQAGSFPEITVFDKVIGNAAALLAVRVNCREAFSPMGSELAKKSLQRFGVRYYFTETVPFVMRPDRNGMCPMEQLSLGMEPDQFYEEMLRRIAGQDEGTTA